MAVKVEGEQPAKKSRKAKAAASAAASSSSASSSSASSTSTSSSPPPSPSSSSSPGTKAKATDPAAKKRPRRLPTSKMLPFAAARAMVRLLNIPSQKAWYEYCRSGQRPPNIPSTPHKVYNDFISYPDYLGYEGRSPPGKMLEFEEARAEVQKAGLKSQAQWKRWSKSGQRPPNIPSNPHRMYAKRGAEVAVVAGQKFFVSWPDWLGYVGGKRGGKRTKGVFKNGPPKRVLAAAASTAAAAAAAAGAGKAKAGGGGRWKCRGYVGAGGGKRGVRAKAKAKKSQKVGEKLKAAGASVGGGAKTGKRKRKAMMQGVV